MNCLAIVHVCAAIVRGLFPLPCLGPIGSGSSRVFREIHSDYIVPKTIRATRNQHAQEVDPFESGQVTCYDESHPDWR